MESVADSYVSSPENVSCCYEDYNVAPLEEDGTEEVFTPLQEEKERFDVHTRKDSGRVTKKSRRNRSSKDRKCSGPLILKWLEDNYETIPGACLPRSVLYTHYQDFCKRNLVEPSSAASFGKIIRMKFPNLSTRRLGTRGQSKYHYYGLAIKETSVYFRSVYSKRGLTRFSGASLKRESGQFYNPTSKTGILLPDFPKIKDLNFGKPLQSDKVETFLLMYRAHCQRILDSVVRTNFHEVQDFLMHFWQGMPQHMLPILGSQSIVDLVVICDFILYNCLCEVLIPANLQQLPDNLVEEVITFSHTLVEWLFTALQDLPSPLGIRKVQGAEMFGKALRRQTAMMQLAKGARSVLRGSDSVTSILNDWRSIDFESAASQVVFPNQFSEQTTDLFKEFAVELEQLLVKQSSLEVYFEWLDSLVERKVCEPANKGLCSLQEVSQEFLASWSNFYHVVEKEVSLLKGKSFDFYRQIHLVLSEYIHHVMESLHSKLIESQYNNILTNGRGPDKAHPTDPAMSNVNSGAMSLPPIFPPTPSSACSEKDFIHYFETKMAHEFSSETALYSSCFSSLQSPTFGTMGIGESPAVYDGYFHPEVGVDPLYLQRQVSMPPSSLNVPSGNPMSLDNVTTPLTPQSSLSSSSPLSHTSIQSPRESLSLTPDLIEGGNSATPGRPMSQVSMYNVESPLSHCPPTSTVAPSQLVSGGAYGSSASGLTPTGNCLPTAGNCPTPTGNCLTPTGNCPPATICSSPGSACTSPLQHLPAVASIAMPVENGGAGLSIAASLDLVASNESEAISAGISCNPNMYLMETPYRVQGMSLTPPPPMSHYNHHHHASHQHHHHHHPQQQHLAMSPSCAQVSPHSLIPDPHYSMMASDMGSCPQYSFELHHLNPSDLLAEPRDTKPSMMALTQSATPIV